LRFVNARSGIGHDGAAARRLPNGPPRLCVHGDDETFAAPRALFNELLVILIVAENNFVPVKHGRGAAAVLADKGAKIPLPSRFAVMIQGCQQVVLRFVPNHVNPLGIHGRRGSGITIELMPWKRREWKITPPDEFPVRRAEAENVEAAGLVAGARQENAVAPEDGRGMSGARQLDLPIDVGIADFCGDGLGVADTRAVWPAKAGPFLGEVGGSKRAETGGNQCRPPK